MLRGQRYLLIALLAFLYACQASDDDALPDGGPPLDQGMAMDAPPHGDLPPPILDSDTPRPDGPCIPECSGRQCGPDGCGGSCGMCSDIAHCVMGRCEEKVECRHDSGCAANESCYLDTADSGHCVSLCDPVAPTTSCQAPSSCNIMRIRTLMRVSGPLATYPERASAISRG